MLPKRIASYLLLGGCILAAASAARADVNYGDYEMAQYVGDAHPFEKWDSTTPYANEGFWGGWEYVKLIMDQPVNEAPALDEAASAYCVTRLTQRLFKPLPEAVRGPRPSKSPDKTKQ